MTSRPDDPKWLEENLLPVMITETDPYGPRDLENSDDLISDVPQFVVDAMEELDRATLADMRRNRPKRLRGKTVLWDGKTGTVEGFHRKLKEAGKETPRRGTDTDRS